MGGRQASFFAQFEQIFLVVKLLSTLVGAIGRTLLNTITGASVEVARVDVGETDRCMFGLKTWGRSKHKLVPARKPTKLMTNSRAIGNELRRRCDRSRQH